MTGPAGKLVSGLPRYLALIALTFVLFVTSWSTLRRPFVLIAVGLLVWTFIRCQSRTLPRVAPQPIIVAAIALLAYDFWAPNIIHDFEGQYPAVAYARIVDLVWVLLSLILLIRVRRGQSVAGRWRAAVVAVAAVAGAALVIVTPDPAIDVWRLHQQAGDVLIQGDNPYADLSIASTFPADADSRLITGYPYTPPNLLVFGGSAAITGESRWFSLACWLGFVGLFATLRRGSGSGTALLLLLASQPGWQIVLELGYTEALTLLLLVGAVVAWKHRRTLGPVLLGVGLATKQYLAVLAPMVLAARMIPIRSRLVTLLAAGATVAAGLIWGAGDYIDAIAGFHFRVPPQPDSVNLYGVSVLLDSPIVIPAAVGLVISVGVGLLSSRSARTPSQLLVGAATALGIGFLLASQAFINYWLLVGGILALALLLAEPEGPSDADRDASVSRHEVDHVR